ncbi:kinase-like domain-containing protein [Syncephalis plumigaleata]|nr:kinase-like domain-containing protein [Syncephalis plumigaleata]
MDNSISSVHRLSTASSSSQDAKESDAVSTPLMLDSDFFARYGIEPSSPSLDSPLPKRVQTRLFTDKGRQSSTSSEMEQHSDNTVNSGGSALFSSPIEDTSGVKDNQLAASKDSMSPIMPSSAVKLSSPFLPILATAPRVTKRHLNAMPRRPIKLGPPARSLRHEQSNDNEDGEDVLMSLSSSLANEPDKRTSNAHVSNTQFYDESHNASINSEANVSHATRMDNHSFSLPNHSTRSADEHANPSYRINTALSQSFRDVSDAVQVARPMSSTTYANTVSSSSSANKQTESHQMESTLSTDAKCHLRDELIAEKSINTNIQHATPSYKLTSSYGNESVVQQEPTADDMSVVDQSNTGRTMYMNDTTARTKGQPSLMSRVSEPERELSSLTGLSKLEMPSIKVSRRDSDINTAAPVVMATATPAEANVSTHANTDTNTPATTATAAAAAAGSNGTYIINGRQFFRLKLIGKGGSSRVYKVMAPSNRIFAMKRVTLRKADKSTIESYLNEIQLLTRLSKHECIINLFDWEYDKERKIITMLLECGEIDLDGILRKRNDKPISINFILLYWEQMLHAVNAIHEEKIVHSDLKPANFLLVQWGKKLFTCGSLKLIDFGIAKAIGNDTTNIHRDQQIGTLNYMSPEALQDTNTAIPGQPHQQLMKLGRSSDVWSLGCILYQMIYGHTPFSHLNMLQKIQSKLRDCLSATTAPSSSGQGAFTVDPEFIRVLRSCLIRDPKGRATIPQLLADPILHRQGSSHGKYYYYYSYCNYLLTYLLIGLLRAFMQEYQRSLATTSTSTSSTGHGAPH